MSAVGRPPRILVVDDDETVADVVSRDLERESFEVERVVDGESALAAVGGAGARPRRPRPDAAAAERAEVCRRLRPRRLPIVMPTARGEESDRIMGLELGADDYPARLFEQPPTDELARLGRFVVTLPVGARPPAGAGAASPRAKLAARGG
jgi:DNA-binding response OmpR family regulator